MKAFLSILPYFCLIAVLTTTARADPTPLNCPTDTDEIIYYPVEGRCDLFWECYDGKVTQMMCPVGLWWHQEISECDYWENVNCGSHTAKPQTSSTTAPGTTKTPPICPTDTNEITYYNYKGDCSKYWECYAGHATAMQCPTGLWWHEEISQCDYKENVNCQ